MGDGFSLPSSPTLASTSFFPPSRMFSRPSHPNHSFLPAQLPLPSPLSIPQIPPSFHPLSMITVNTRRCSIRQPPGTPGCVCVRQYFLVCDWRNGVWDKCITNHSQERTHKQWTLTPELIFSHSSLLQDAVTMATIYFIYGHGGYKTGLGLFIFKLQWWIFYIAFDRELWRHECWN